METDEFGYLWKWFEVHVTHRTQMLNFLLVTSGILAVAYVNFLEKCKFGPAAVLAATGALVTLSFFALDVITLRKILRAKRLMRKSTWSGERDIMTLLLWGEKPPRGLWRDPLWTTLVEAVLCGGYVAAAIYAKRHGSVPMYQWVFPFLVFIVIAIIGDRTSKKGAA